ncbi:MAG: nucleotidyltransferase domain-containing protein [Gammaproteobacteria bacterium]|nr:nucleotidyltransferase domain-containing protein [Gammaproteobacteria bacterium]
MPITTRERFERALDVVQQDLEHDDHVLAAVLCGSLSYDEVWDKSDIDLVVITTDEKERLHNEISLTAEDVNIHTSLIPRNTFRRNLESAARNSFQHSIYARSTLLFSKDPSIDSLYDGIHSLGKHDLHMQMMGHTQHTIALLYKAKKWLLVKNDPHYTAHWVLNTASCLASVVVSRAGKLVDREALVEATKLEPELFKLIYTDLFDKKISQRSLSVAIEAIDDYLEALATELFEPVIEYLKAAFGEPRTSTELEHHFSRTYGLEHTVTACEWLSDLGLIEKASVATKLTLHSQNEVEELAFFVA